MKNYTNDSPHFSESISITETTDAAHADNINAAPKQLLQNTLVLKTDTEALKKQSEVLMGTADPTESTKGEIGQTYLNTDTKKTFICTDADHDAGVYSWTGISGGVAPQLIVKVDTGSLVTVSKGETTLTATAADGQAKFDIPDYGEWSITATLDGASASDSITVSEVKQFEVTLTYFSATLTVNTEAYAHVTATNGTATYEGEAKINGKCVLTIKAAGSYSVKATKNGGVSQTVSKAISNDSGSYTTALNFAKIVVSVSAGSFIQVAKGSVTLTDTTTGTSTFYLPSTGTWSITSTLGDKTVNTICNASRYTNYEIDLSYYKIMTAVIDLSESDPSACITYADDAEGMTAGSDDWDTFFGHYPCLLKNGKELGALNPDDFTMYETGEVVGELDADTDVMIAFPRHGLKITTDGNKITVSMTDDPDNADFEYYAHHRGTSTKKDVFYLGAYKAYVSSDYMYSIPDVTPTTGNTLSAYREYAHNRGDGYEQSGFYQLLYRQCMYILKYKNLDSQETIGEGYTSGSALKNTGATAQSGMDHGTDNANTQMKLFGIEDFWGNCSERIDGLATDSSLNILTNTTNFQDDGKGTGYYTVASGVTIPSSAVGGIAQGYMSATQGTTETGFIYKAASGSSTTYFCDTASFKADANAYFGGYYNDGSAAGIFYLRLESPVSGNSGSSVGARLMYL